MTPEEFASTGKRLIEAGATFVGGCCGTNPEHIKAVINQISGKKPIKRDIKPYTAITSYQRSVIVDKDIAVIGERINPTGKKKLKHIC